MFIKPCSFDVYISVDIRKLFINSFSTKKYQKVNKKYSSKSREIRVINNFNTPYYYFSYQII